MKSTKETTELFLAVAGVLKAYNKSKSDDGRVSLPEIVGIVSANITAIFSAARGAGEIVHEAKDFTEEELIQLYEDFLTELEWEPTEDAKDRAASVFILVKNIYVDLSRIFNTFSPPKAELA